MFTLTKNARIHKSVASESFSQAEISVMTPEAGTEYYAFPFECPVLGCGTEPPDGHDPNKRSKIPRDPAYKGENLLEDIETLLNTPGVGLEILVNGINRGVDLELRAKARPKARAKMSEADKAAWVLNNRAEALQQVETVSSETLAAWYDANVAA